MTEDSHGAGVRSEGVYCPPASALWVPAVFIGFAAACAIFSTGFIEADEMTHFLNSKKVYVDWTALLSIWGRFGCTGFFALAAPFGLAATRLTAVGVMVLTALATARVARRVVEPRGFLGRHSTAFIFLLLFAQPCFAMNSFTVMTEMLLACCWINAALLLVHEGGRDEGNIVAAGFMLGLGGLMRPEGWVAMAVWPAFLYVWLGRGERPRGAVMRDIAWSMLASAAPSLVWYGLGLAAYGDVLWPVHKWPWDAASRYGRTPLGFLLAAVSSMGLWMWWPIGVGIWGAMRKRGGRMMMLAAGPFVGFFVLHGTLGVLGLFGSMSLPRYFVCVGPFAGILAWAGLMEMEQRRAGLARGAAIGLSLGTFLPFVVTGQLPIPKSLTLRRLDVAAERIRKFVPREEFATRVIFGHPYLHYVLDVPLGVGDRVFNMEDIRLAPKGTLLCVEQEFWAREGRADPETLRSWGWEDDLVVTATDDMTPARFPLVQLDNAHARLWVKR